MMRPTPDVRKLFRQSPVWGAWTSIGHPSITEAFGTGPAQFLGIDLEHSTISQEQAQRLIAAGQAAGLICLPRVASHNGEQIRRVLDSGADGVIVPNVSTLQQIEQIVDWAKYPPVGRRGFGVARAQGYGSQFDAYVTKWNERSGLIIQIESIAAVESIDTLLANEWIDGVMVGPYDLSGSLGIPGQITHARVTEACRRVIAACRKHRKACGTHLVEPTESTVRGALQAGYTFVVLASDVFILWKWNERMTTLVAGIGSPKARCHAVAR